MNIFIFCIFYRLINSGEAKARRSIAKVDFQTRPDAIVEGKPVLDVNKIRSHKTLAALWPFGRHTGKPVDFEHVHLPDEGQEFLKPPLEMLIQEQERASSPEQREAAAHFRTGEEMFKNWQYREAVEFYQASHEVSESLSALLACGVALMMVSELRKSAEVFKEGRNLSRQREALRFEAAFGINLGQVCNDLSEPDRSQEALEGAQDLCEEIEDAALETMALRHLGTTFLAQALYNEALTCCDEAIQISEVAKAETDSGHALCHKGIIYVSKGDLLKAEEVFQQGLILTQRLKDMYFQGRIYTNLANLYLIRGNAREAVSILKCALEIHINIGYRQGEARNLGLLAVIQMAQGDFEEGHRTFEQAVDLDRKLGYRRGEVRETLTLARTLLQIGQADEVRDLYQSVYDLAKEMNYRRVQVETSAMLALLVADVQMEERISMLEDAMALIPSIHNPVIEIQISSHRGLLYANAGQFDQAVNFCQQAVIYSREIGNLIEEAKSLINLAYVQDQHGEKELAAENMSTAQALFQSQGLEPIPELVRG